MRVVNIRVQSKTLQPVVVMRKGELELLVSVTSKNPRTRWLHVSTHHRRVYVSDGYRILTIEDTRAGLADIVGASYLVPIPAIKEMTKIMKAAHHVAITRDLKDRALVLALVETPVNYQFGDDMAIEQLGKVTYARPTVSLGTGTQGITVEGMDARIAEAIEEGEIPDARHFFLSTDFMVVVGRLPKVVKSHTSELFVGAGANDPLVFRTTGPEGSCWTYYAMPQKTELPGLKL
jgi:hypothetical protein